jgi:peptidoglycan/LPS O-acetylase OafA/YrhL
LREGQQVRQAHRHPAGRTLGLVELPTGTRAQAAAPAVAATRSRLIGLDGIRGLAALFVVTNHIFLRAFSGYPADHAPWWASPFIYGRFAVVVFIVLSGFSLALSPARAGWQLGGLAKFARRRAWRILPPYWAALVFSVLMTWFVVAQPGWPIPNAQSVAVNGLLVQDVFGVPSPNRAFWSIAIEAQLYVAFPLLILAMRRLNAVVMLTCVAAPVCALGICSALRVRTATALINQYTPDLAVLFAVGVLAGAIVTATDRRRAWPWHWFALAFAVPVFVLIAWQGSIWTIDNFFWVDLALGPAIGCLLAAVTTARPRPLVRALETRPLRRLGSFSYSLYLTHAPIVIAVYYGFMVGRVPRGVPMFLLLCVIVLPLTVLFARLFAAVFELPFQRQRGWGAIRDAVRLPTRRGRSELATVVDAGGERSIGVSAPRPVEDVEQIIAPYLEDAPRSTLPATSSGQTDGLPGAAPGRPSVCGRKLRVAQLSVVVGRRLRLTRTDVVVAVPLVEASRAGVTAVDVDLDQLDAALPYGVFHAGE